ncbi:MAG: hypothetical protein ACHQ5A_15490, partial [Opitutales bacterium]
MKAETPANRHILLTPPGAGAIAVIRLLGPAVGDFLREHFSRPVPPVSSPAEFPVAAVPAKVIGLDSVARVPNSVARASSPCCPYSDTSSLPGRTLLPESTGLASAGEDTGGS